MLSKAELEVLTEKYEAKKLYQTSTVCCQKLKGQNAYG